MKVNLTAFLCTCILFATITFRASAQFNPQKLTNDLQQVVTKDSLPGMAVVLVDTKGIVYQHTFGYADLSSGKPYNLQTTQEIGSVSKMVLAAALMKAIELGYFTLDTDINQVMPFKIVNPLEPSHNITIRELATHTSGIKDNPNVYINVFRFYKTLRPYNPASLQILEKLGYQQTLSDTTLTEFYYNYLNLKGKYYNTQNFVYTPNKRTSVYSNIATALIAYLIELKSGMAYSTFTAKYIFKPLRMKHSAWFVADVKPGKLAQLYYNAQVNFPLYDLVTYPDGGLKTNAEDLSKFLMDMMNGLSGKSAILKAASFREMFTTQFNNMQPPARISLAKRNKGILWNLYTNGTIGHDGDDPGVSSFIAFNPATGLGGLFTCNKYLDDKSAITDIITYAIGKQR